MRMSALAVLGVLTLAGCGGDSDSNGDGATDAAAIGVPGGLDPCVLADESILASYFGETAVEPERSEAGPIDGCSWHDANANSLLIQTAQDYDLFRPDPCDGCVDVTFGDDGYATESPVQSTAEVIDGSSWLSVTTTGFGDDSASIIALLEQVFGNATG